MHEESVVFDKDLCHYGVVGGVQRLGENEVYAPVAMWIEALDLILGRMLDGGFDFPSVKGVSGAGQQHGSVWATTLPDRHGQLLLMKGAGTGLLRPRDSLRP